MFTPWSVRERQKYKRRAGEEVGSAGILGEGGIVLDVMWVGKDTGCRQVQIGSN